MDTQKEAPRIPSALE